MRKLMKPLLLSVGLFVCPAIAICQQPVPATLSLSDAIALAREHNPAYRQTIHDRSPAAWGVRNAWSSLWLPSVTASGGVGYAGPGEQNFLTSSFSQSVSTWSSSYSFLLDWTLNGQTISQPGLKQAQVARGAAEVSLLRARTVVQVEKLRLFQQIGVSAPVDLGTVQLTDTFTVQTPTWRLSDLLGMAEQQNPSLKALRDRERAQTDSLACAYENAAWLNTGQTPLNCAVLINTAPEEQALRDQNNRYPFHFTPQPFQARLTVSIPLWGNFQ